MTRPTVRASLLAALAVAVLLPASSQAVTLSLDNPGGTSYQQTSNRPCIIGDPSCNNPGGFSMTLIPANTASYTLNSPTYTVDQIRNIVGDVFFVGIDVNSDRKPTATEILNAFSLNVGGAVTPQFVYTGSSNLIELANGNGFSDDLLVGFNLTGFSGAASAVFSATVSNATAGREEFFLVAGSPATVPEPSSVILFGTMLAGVGAWQQRRRLSRSN